MLAEAPPRIIHIRIGNCSIREFFIRIVAGWPDVVALSQAYKLVIVFKDRIEAITWRGLCNQTSPQYFRREGEIVGEWRGWVRSSAISAVRRMGVAGAAGRR